MPKSDLREGVTSGSRRTAMTIITLVLLTLGVGLDPVIAEGREQVLDQIETLEVELTRNPVLPGEVRRLRQLRHRISFLRQQLGNDATADLDQRLRRLNLQVRGLVRVQEASEPETVSSGSIQGLVRRTSDGGPLAEVYVELWDPDGYYLYSETTDTAGAYAFADLAPGTYYLSTTNALGYIDELWDDFPCPGSNPNGCTIVEGTPLEVATGTLEANFELDLGSSITGTVRDHNGLLLPGMKVDVWRGDLFVTSGYTNDDGDYEAGGLTAGTYRVTTESFGQFLDELYDNRPCPGGGFIGCMPSEGDPVSVASASTTAIDFTLDRFGTISGRVTDQLTGLPIPWMNVTIFDQEGHYAASTYTDDAGQYQAGGLNAGTYFALASDFDGFETQLYQGLSCPPASCNPTTGTAIPVLLNVDVTGIDFALVGGCVQTETALCLNDNRFRVETRWRTAQGGGGAGQAFELTADTGYFWFFSVENVELFVKVIDACSLPGFNSFWVFSGGMTNVEVTMTVTDTATGVDRVYTNDLGTPFAPVQDTAAFGSCP